LRKDRSEEGLGKRKEQETGRIMEEEELVKRQD
jgi:hypothetical protein